MVLKKLIFPTTCVVCGGITESNSSHICNRCYRALPFRRSFFFNCPTKNDGLQYCHGIFCPLHYMGEVPKLISSLKFSGHKEVGIVLGGLLAKQLLRSGFNKSGSVLIPVPLHRDRERRRGYNQAEVIARAVSLKTGIPLKSDWLLRRNNTAPQHHGNRIQRLSLDPGFVASPRVRGKVVILVDDVITTGATLETAAKILRANGARAVYYAATAGNLPLNGE